LRPPRVEVFPVFFTKNFPPFSRWHQLISTFYFRLRVKYDCPAFPAFHSCWFEPSSPARPSLFCSFQPSPCGFVFPGQLRFYFVMRSPSPAHLITLRFPARGPNGGAPPISPSFLSFLPLHLRFQPQGFKFSQKC